MNIASLGYSDRLASDAGAMASVLRRNVVEVRSGDSGCGAGILWPGGLIVTNAHCVTQPFAGARLEIAQDDARRTAKLVAHDRRRDLALLSAPGLTALPLELRDVDSLRAGELVFAYGHPLGVRDALAMGVVHGVARDARTGEARFVVADVRLAPGNSGGPLVDADARLIGINSMVINGLGVAVPVGVIHRFVERVLATHAA